MKRFLTLARRYALLCKRLFKKPGFLMILLLVPLLVLALHTVNTREESGMMTVALAMQDPEDEIAREIVDSLLEDASLIRFTVCERATDATALVENGTADAAWLFPENMKARIAAFTGGLHRRYAVVTVIERESNVLMLLSHEVLSSALYPYCSRALYRDFVSDNVIVTGTLSEEELDRYYEAIDAEGEDLFRFVTADGEQVKNGGGYLLAPIRGLLAILTVLGGLATALFYTQDMSEGRFHWMRPSMRLPFEAAYHMTAVGSMAVAMLVALSVTGLTVSALREIVCLLLFVLMTTGFVMAVRLLLKEIRAIGAAIPVIVIAMTALCPVFFDLNLLPAVRALFPPFYYLSALYRADMIPYMLIYTVAVFILDALLYRLRGER
ncbi:MAG: hypothetical protein IJV98_04345 [Clostridia bacterium]|nr:hypothetical protein [Clostridia bacterium]